MNRKFIAGVIVIAGLVVSFLVLENSKLKNKDSALPFLKEPDSISDQNVVIEDRDLGRDDELESQNSYLQSHVTELENEFENYRMNYDFRVNKLEKENKKLKEDIKEFSFCLFNWDSPDIKNCALVLYSAL